MPAVVFQTPVDLPVHPQRRLHVHALIRAMNACDDVRMVDPPVENSAPYADTIDLIAAVHSRSYITALQKRVVGRCARTKRTRDDLPALDEYSSESDDEDNGFTGDCRPYRQMWAHAFGTVYGTIAAVQAVISGQTPIAIHWEGGRHHAHYDRAAGFCFLNDVAIAAKMLVKSGFRVLVADFDAHHGDGTEELLLGDEKIFTLSMHSFGVGVFPHSGAPELTGGFSSPRTCLNVVLPIGATDAFALPLWEKALAACVAEFNPSAVLAVCGVDAIAGDPLGHLGLTIAGVTKLFNDLKALHLPMVCVGAGGYHDPSSARAMTSMTFSAHHDRVMPSEIPDACESFSIFRPTFDSWTTPNRQELPDPKELHSFHSANERAIASIGEAAVHSNPS